MPKVQVHMPQGQHLRSKINALSMPQVDVLIDETYAFDPTSYNFQTFLNTFGLTGQEPYPFLQTRRVYR